MGFFNQMSPFVQFAIICSLSHFLMGCDKDSATTVTSDHATNESNTSTTDGKCSKWSVFSTSQSLDFTKDGLYCQKDGTTYKCDDSVSGITVGKCPDNVPKRMLRARQSDSVADCASWEHVGPNISQGGLYCRRRADGQTFKCKDQTTTGNNISVGICPSNVPKRMLDSVSDCASWEYFGPKSADVSQGGVYCQTDDKTFKCKTSSNGNDNITFITVANCPDNVSSSAKLVTVAPLTDVTDKVLDTESKNSDADLDEAMKQLDKTMEQLKKNIAACPSWVKSDSNDMTKSGLYCGQNGQNYKCTSTPAGTGISFGTCPQNLKTSASPSVNGIADHIYNNDAEKDNKMWYGIYWY